MAIRGPNRRHSPHQPTEESLLKLLRVFALRPTITRRENAELTRRGFRSKMPADFYDRNSSLFNDPLARYRVVGIAASLKERLNESWYPG